MSADASSGEKGALDVARRSAPGLPAAGGPAAIDEHCLDRCQHDQRPATSVVEKTFSSKSIARRRRRSNSAALPCGLMNQGMGESQLRALIIQGSINGNSRG